MTILSKAGRSSLLLMIAMTMVLALMASPALHATGSSGSSNRCVVKFVCGEIDGDEDAARVVAGSYRTSINVLNGSSRTVTYKKKLLTTTPCEEEGGETATF